MSFNLNSYLDREPIKTFLRSMAGVINYIRILNIEVEIPGEPSGQSTPVTPPSQDAILMEDSNNILLEDNTNLLLEEA